MVVVQHGSTLVDGFDVIFDHVDELPWAGTLSMEIGEGMRCLHDVEGTLWHTN